MHLLDRFDDYETALKGRRFGYEQHCNQSKQYDPLPFRLCASFLDAAFSKSLMLRIFSSRSAVGIGIGAPPAIAIVTVQNEVVPLPLKDPLSDVSFASPISHSET